MNKPNTKCRVCGKEYFCCSDSKVVGSWRTMACCKEHFQEYMKRIEESRKPQINEVEKTTNETLTTYKRKTSKKSMTELKETEVVENHDED